MTDPSPSLGVRNMSDVMDGNWWAVVGIVAGLVIWAFVCWAALEWLEISDGDRS